MQEVKITVRMPADLHARLVELAERDTRSLNSEILHLLKAGAALHERNLSARQSRPA